MKTNSDNPMYAYFLPSGRDIDDMGVREAMLCRNQNLTLFLDLTNGDIIELTLPQDTELRNSMKKELFAYAEIPRIEIDPGMRTALALNATFQNFLSDLPVTIVRDEAVYEDELLLSSEYPGDTDEMI